MPEGDKQQDLLRAFLAENDVPCPQCGYNLRMLTSDICPECGDRLVLGIRLAEPKEAEFLAGLIGLSVGAGFSGLLLLYALLRMIADWNVEPWISRFVLVNAVSMAVMATLLVMWFKRRRWIRMRSLPLRRRLAMGCWLTALIDLVVFCTAIR